MEIIHKLKESNQIRKITGILNGTTNFILDCVEKGSCFLESVQRAQLAGFAEADPTLDLNGTDALHKICIAAKLAFGNFPYSIQVKGIDKDIVSTYSGLNSEQRIRLIATSIYQQDKIEITVKPTVLPTDHPFANVNGAENCVIIELENEQNFIIQGKGAGRWPTAESVYADLLDIYHVEQQQQAYQIKALASLGG